ncbi:hypothetical protein LSH36_147g02013 [Paralvinella palmiformis]|uniref:Uncharacterized protein n=1 Tax=Paralvinella palmiformis TaxID=53620 RepID=A0AAD9JVR5_9ANNE|nr:hypothetical protein LSH36_147g02013 [Paralvinella palmiformis]
MCILDAVRRNLCSYIFKIFSGSDTSNYYFIQTRHKVVIVVRFIFNWKKWKFQTVEHIENIM